MGIERVQFHRALVWYGGSFYTSLDKLTRVKAQKHWYRELVKPNRIKILQERIPREILEPLCRSPFLH